MKKFLSIFTLLGLLVLFTACNEDSPHASQTVFVPATTQKKVYSPAPPQPIHFNSLEEAKDFILSDDPDLSNYQDDWQEAYKQMIAKFRKEGFFPYVEVDGGKEIRSVCLHPQVDFEDVGVNHAYSYKGHDFVSFIYFMREDIENKAESGILNYLNWRLNTNLTDYKDETIVFNGQKVKVVFSSSSLNQIIFIVNENMYVNVQSKATEAEIIDFIEHMAIEKFSLA